MIIMASEGYLQYEKKGKTGGRVKVTVMRC